MVAPRMLARTQQLIAFTLVCAAIAAFVLGARTSRLWLGVAFVGVVIVGYTGVLALEFWLLRQSYARKDAARPRIAQLARAWAVEVLVAPRVFLWQQPFRSASEPDHLPPGARDRRGVVLVHGFFCNRGLWNPLLRRLRAANVPFVAVSLEPIFGSIDGYAPTIAAAVAALERATGLAPLIVAHSMGGLAVRAWLAANGEARVHRLITVASPHAGTRLALHGRGRNVAQMRHGSEWLAELARRGETTTRTQVVCFWSHCDNIVFPTRSATLAGADNRHLEGTPHVAMAFHPAVFDEVLGAAHAAA
ncbi:MAG: lipase family alpha/beta hydrolase [Gemmatimonadaceae bacterium]